MEMLEPMLRADFKIIETRQYQHDEPLNLPITVFAGEDDPSATSELLQPWREQTASGFWMKIFPGDHFYLQEQQAPLLRQISNLLCMTPRIAM
jgi:surfactin synthase thioesterase subunit